MKVPTSTHFYRYSSAQHLDWLKTIILNHQVYFPTINQLNDPVEGKPLITESSDREIARFLIRMWSSANPTASLDEVATRVGEVHNAMALYGVDWVRGEMTALLHKEFDSAHVFSMSKRWDNMGMWAKYADNHKGYCLEFANEGLFKAAREVEYGDTIQVDVTSPADVSVKFLFQKTRDWITEEEVRLYSPTTCPSEISFDPVLLTRIILGRNMSADDATSIRSWAATRNPPLKVVEAKWDAMKQQLCIASS